MITASVASFRLPVAGFQFPVVSFSVFENVQMSQTYFTARCTIQGRGGDMGKSYKELIVWQKAMVLVRDIYSITKLFPREELYGLASQLRRASVSIPSNVAEGQARFSSKEFHHFLSNARGSLMEVETQVLIAEDLGYISREVSQQILTKTAELGRMLNGLISSIRPAA
jgi:four helix bundle protein